MAAEGVAGLTAGCACVVVGHPLDTVKVRLQTQSSHSPSYRGIAHCFLSIVRKETVFGLYKGMSSSLLGYSVLSALSLGVYGESLRLLGGQHGSETSSLLATFGAGCTAGFAQSFVASPVELVKTRLQLHGQGVVMASEEKMRLVKCCQQICRTEGIRGMTRGLVTTLFRDIPSFGLYFVVYESFLRFFSRINRRFPRINRRFPRGLAVLLAGGMAGSAAWTIIYPCDVIKSRLQADGVNGNTKYRGIFHCIVKSIQKEGFGVLTRGLGTRLIASFPVEGTFLLVYEICLKMLGQNSHI